MKTEIQSKKGLRTILSVSVDKETIQKKMDERLNELQKEVSLKGFRTGKVPTSVIKNQFGKSIYGEVIDKILRETSTKAIEEKKIKVAGQPKIDLKTFGEGKDLNYELQIDSLPDIKLKPFDRYKAIEYKVKIEEKIINEKLKEFSIQNKQFEDKKEGEKAIIGDQVTLTMYAHQSHSGSNGAWRSTVPFAAPGGSLGHRAAGTCLTDSMNSGSNANFWGLYKDYNNTNLWLFYITAGGGWSHQETGHDNNFTMIASITYPTT